MALTKCKECGSEISTEAKSCPKCGVGLPKKTSKLTWIVLILIVFGVISAFTATNERANSAEMERVKAQAAEQARLAAMTPKQRAAETEIKALQAKAAADQAAKIAAAAAKKDNDEQRRGLMAMLAVKTIKENLRDPDSAKWESIRANDDGSVVCLNLRARNGFGGMNLEHYAIFKGKISQSASAWNRHCTGELWDMKSWINTDRF